MTLAIKFSNKDLYVGFVNAEGLYHGYGRLFVSTGYEYNGNWNNGIKQGLGIELYERTNFPRRLILLCQYHSDEKNTFILHVKDLKHFINNTNLYQYAQESLGNLYQVNIDTLTSNMYYYHGYFDNNKKHGHGCLNSSRTRRNYIGEFDNDLFNGEGTLTVGDTYKYIGWFKDGKYDGKCVIYDTNYKFEGEYNHGVKKGKLHNLHLNTIFEGVFKNNKQHCGKLIYPNGDIYEGFLIDNLKHGRGIYTYNEIKDQNRVQQLGKWSNDIFIS